MGKVTDPALLAQLESPVATQRGRRVVDPALLSQLEQEPFDAGQMVRNIPGSAGQFVADITQPIRHPIQTAKGLWKAGSGAAEMLVPGEQGNEPYARAVGQGLKERYGGAQRLRRTLQNDPVGLAADVAGLATGGSTLAAKGLSTAARAGRTGDVLRGVAAGGRALDPMTGTLRAVGAVIPKALPRKAMESAMKLRTTLPRKDRAGVVETMLENRAMPTEKGVNKLRARQFDLGDQLDTLIAQAGAQGGRVPVSAVTQGLEKLRQEYGRPSVAGASNLKAVDAAEQAFLDHVNRNGPAALSVEDLQNIKTDAYKRISFDRSNQKADLPTQEAYKSIARDARGEIEKQVPQIADVNRQYGDIERALPEAERAANRIGNRDFMGIGIPIKIGAGTAIGGGNFLGGAAGALLGGLDTPRIKSWAAIQAEALRKRKLANPSYTGTRAAAAQAGRLPEDQQE